MAKKDRLPGAYICCHVQTLQMVVMRNTMLSFKERKTLSIWCDLEPNHIHRWKHSLRAKAQSRCSSSHLVKGLLSKSRSRSGMRIASQRDVPFKYSAELLESGSSSEKLPTTEINELHDEAQFSTTNTYSAAGTLFIGKNKPHLVPSIKKWWKMTFQWNGHHWIGSLQLGNW